MTWWTLPRHGKFFASSASLQSLTLPAHDAALAGDTLYQIQFNFEWREIVASALQFYFRHDDTALALDNEDLLNNVLIDLYTAEPYGSLMATKTRQIGLLADETTTSATFVQVATMAYTHVFTKPKALIRYTLFLVNSGANDSFVRPSIDGAAGADNTIAKNNGNVGRTVVAVDRFEGITPGSHSVGLQMRAGGGTARINSTFTPILEIIEYD